MIRKILAVGSHVFFANSKHEINEDQFRTVELDLPIAVYDKARALLSNYEFKLSDPQYQANPKKDLKEFFQTVAAYAINDRDRATLYTYFKPTKN